MKDIIITSYSVNDWNNGEVYQEKWDLILKDDEPYRRIDSKSNITEWDGEKWVKI